MDLNELLAQHHWADDYVVLPIAEEPYNSLILLFKHCAPFLYPPGVAHIPAYYFGSHTLYNAAQELCRHLQGSGYQSQANGNFFYKSAAESAGLARMDTTLVFHPKFGTYVSLAPVKAAAVLPQRCIEQSPVCTHCGLCTAACPGGALCNGAFTRSKCIRLYLDGKNLPPPDMQTDMMVLGCEVCQRVCPQNPQLFTPMPEEFAQLFSIEHLLNIAYVSAHMEDYKSRIGTNYARRNALINMGCMAAGGSGDAQYLPALQILCGFEDEKVAQMANRAIAQITAQAD